MPKTVIKLSDSGGELDKVVMDYDDATVEAIAQAAITLVQRAGAMREGDTITVTVED